MLIFVSTGILPIPAHQQEAIRRSLLFIQCGNTRQDGLQRHWDSPQRQLPPGGQSHQYLPAEDPHRQVHAFEAVFIISALIPTLRHCVRVKIANMFLQGSPGCCGSCERGDLRPPVQSHRHKPACDHQGAHSYRPGVRSQTGARGAGREVWF